MLAALRRPFAKQRPVARENKERQPHWPVVRAFVSVAGAMATMVPAQLMVQRVRPRARPHLPRLFHRRLCRALGIHVVVRGRPARRGGVLFVANHLSWIDIPVLGSELLASFVAKSEVGGWGFIGWMADLQRTMYVERERRQASGEQRNAIAERLAAHESVILFPEGTSSDGVRVLPFKSSLFAAVEAPGSEAFLIQPVTIAYTRLNGLPITRRQLPSIAWIGDTELAPHALDFVRLGRVRAEIHLHPPVRRADFADRKALARHCRDVVAHGYAAVMRGITA